MIGGDIEIARRTDGAFGCVVDDGKGDGVGTLDLKLDVPADLGWCDHRRTHWHELEHIFVDRLPNIACVFECEGFEGHDIVCECDRYTVHWIESVHG